MPTTVCGCSYKRAKGAILEFGCHDDGSWKKSCNICLGYKAKENNECKEEFDAAVQKNNPTLSCTRCHWSRPRETFMHPSRSGDMQLFQKCNCCAMELCLAARNCHSAWQLECITKYKSTKCTGPNQHTTKLCLFEEVLNELLVELPIRHFSFLLDDDFFIDEGAISNSLLVRHII